MCTVYKNIRHMKQTASKKSQRKKVTGPSVFFKFYLFLGALCLKYEKETKALKQRITELYNFLTF